MEFNNCCTTQGETDFHSITDCEYVVCEMRRILKKNVFLALLLKDQCAFITRDDNGARVSFEVLWIESGQEWINNERASISYLYEVTLK